VIEPTGDRGCCELGQPKSRAASIQVAPRDRSAGPRAPREQPSLRGVRYAGGVLPLVCFNSKVTMPTLCSRRRQCSCPQRAPSAKAPSDVDWRAAQEEQSASKHPVQVGAVQRRGAPAEELVRALCGWKRECATLSKSQACSLPPEPCYDSRQARQRTPAHRIPNVSTSSAALENDVR
jgi:hypothetical protein